MTTKGYHPSPVCSECSGMSVEYIMDAIQSLISQNQNQERYDNTSTSTLGLNEDQKQSCSKKLNNLWRKTLKNPHYASQYDKRLYGILVRSL
jgi:hypothetical protein